IGALSAERVGGEMMRLLAQPQCAATLAVMVKIGMLTSVLAGALSALERLERQPVAADAALRLAVLEITGGAVADLRSAWRLSNATMASVADLVAAARLAAAERWAELSY